MKFTHDFRDDLETLIQEASLGEPFAFVRFADGEKAIIDKRNVQTADGWSSVGSAVMRQGLLAAMALQCVDRYYVGISCPCCDPGGAEFYRTYIGDDDRFSYSNLFANANTDRASSFFSEAAKNWCVVSSAWGSDIRIPTDWSRIDQLEDYVMGTVQRMRNMRQPMLVAAGPLGKLLIYHYWFNQIESFRNTIIDIGSVLDPLLHGRGTRGYHDPNHPNRQKVCRW